MFCPHWFSKVKVYICTYHTLRYILMLEMAWLGRSMSSIEMKWNIKHWHYNLYNGSHRLPCNTQLVLGWNLKILLETGFHSIWFQANQFKVWHPGARQHGQPGTKEVLENWHKRPFRIPNRFVSNNVPLCYAAAQLSPSPCQGRQWPP